MSSSQYDYETRLSELTQGIDNTFKNILEPFIYNNISKYIQTSQENIANVDILDVGCGCGYLTASIAKNFSEINIAGIDISQSAISCAKSHFNLNFRQQDIVNFNEGKKFDVVIYNMVLHNLQELEHSIWKTSILLKYKGIVLITIPHPAFWLTDKISRGKIILKDPFNYNVERFYQIPFQIKNGSQHQSMLNYYHRCLATYLNTFSKYFSSGIFAQRKYCI